MRRDEDTATALAGALRNNSNDPEPAVIPQSLLVSDEAPGPRTEPAPASLRDPTGAQVGYLSMYVMVTGVGEFGFKVCGGR